jgi:hypothetical protein
MGLEVIEHLPAPSSFAPNSSSTSSSLVVFLGVSGHILLESTRSVDTTGSLRIQWALFSLSLQTNKGQEEDLDTTTVLHANTRHEVFRIEYAHQYFSGKTVMLLRR